MHERWLILAVLTLARTAIGFQFQSVVAAAPEMIDRFQLSYTLLGTLIGLYLFPGILVALPGGLLARRFGDKRIVCWGVAAMVAGGAIMAFADNLIPLFAGRILSGAGGVLFNVVVTKMVADWFAGREIGTAFGIMLPSWPLGMAIGLLTLPPLTAATSWQAVMFVPAAVSAVALVLIAVLYRSPPTSSPAPTRLEFGLTRRETALATSAGLVWTFYNAAYIIVLAFGPAFVMAFGHDSQAATAIVSIASWTVIPAVPLFALIAERLGRANLVMHAGFLLSLAAIALIADGHPSVAMFALVGVLCGVPPGSIMALPAQASRPQYLAVAIGIYFTCYYAGMGALPALAGLARDLTGSTAAPLWFAAAVMGASNLMLLLFRWLQARTPAPR
jgi:predicted MFS family arabinose efflux permease